MNDPFSQDRDAAPGRRRPHPRRVRVAESVYQRIDRESGKPVAGKYEFTYRDATGRQVWQTAKGDNVDQPRLVVDVRPDQAECLADPQAGVGEQLEQGAVTVGVACP